MTTGTVGHDGGTVRARPAAFERLAGACAVLAGVSGFMYAVAFVVLQDELLSGLFLMLSGLFTTVVMVAVYERLRETEASFALLALLLGVAGSLEGVMNFSSTALAFGHGYKKTIPKRRFR